MAKPVILLMVALLLCSTLTYAARPEPAFSDNSPAKTHLEDEPVEESCEGVGEEECLVRRSLGAHLDYVYTQKHNQP
ncbi:hypothetical protein SLE2022_363700 [Rubroshorea leprosula]|nr:hypothetical protein SLEP1_g11733 [Rubroshorea leprosula]